MKNKEFVDLVRSGVNPVVVFTKAIEDCENYAEANMRARVVGAKLKHDDVVVMTMDFSGMDDFNIPLESSNYFDRHGNPTLTAREAGQYKSIEDYYLSPDEETPFDVVDAEHIKLYDQYLASGAAGGYIQWLEKLVLSHRAGVLNG